MSSRRREKDRRSPQPAVRRVDPSEPAAIGLLAANTRRRGAKRLVFAVGMSPAQKELALEAPHRFRADELARLRRRGVDRRAPDRRTVVESESDPYRFMQEYFP